MPARYLIRFDDICPTMNWRIWEHIEATLARNNAKPLLAVVPDNRDLSLAIDPPAADFWEHVRNWQAQGFAIALHGYQHIYVNDHRGLVGLTPHSEFATLPEAEQRHKIHSGVAILKEHGVCPDAWIAPSHSFDENTIKSLLAEGINVISDGLALDTYTDRFGAIWVPQQIQGFRPRRRGTWTVCYHHNDWRQQEIDRFDAQVAQYRDFLASLQSVLTTYKERRLGVRDQIYGRGLLFAKATGKRPLLRKIVERSHDLIL